MSTLHLKRDLELSQRLADDYFSFKWKQKLGKEAIIRVAFLMLILFFVVFVLAQNPIFIVGIVLSLFFILYSAATFFSSKRKYLRLLRENKIFDYELTYSTNGLHYKMPTAESNFSWSYFKYYEQNNDVIYLYNNSGNGLIEIISKDKFGEKAYLEIFDLVIANVREK